MYSRIHYAFETFKERVTINSTNTFLNENNNRIYTKHILTCPSGAAT